MMTNRREPDGVQPTTLWVVAMLLVSLSLSTCGGGGGDDEIPTVEEVILGDPDLDGFAINRQGTITGNTIGKPTAGDLPYPGGQQIYRGIFSFDLM